MQTRNNQKENGNLTKYFFRVFTNKNQQTTSRRQSIESLIAGVKKKPKDKINKNDKTVYNL